MIKPKRVAIYARVSTSDKQDVAMQVRELTEYASTRGWELAGVYADEGFSGTNTRRPKLQELLKDSRARRFDAVLVWRLDRFGRSLRELVGMLQDLSEVGVEFCSLKDALDLTTASGRLMAHMIAAFSEFEASIIRERVRSGIAHARACGKRLGRPQVRDDAAILELRASGLSVRKIAAQLGLSKSTVHAVLAGVQKTPAKPA